MFSVKHILCCFINDPIGVSCIDQFNVDNLCWESDFPHSDGTGPTPPRSLAEACSPPLSDEHIAKITHENAMRHYQFDPFAHRPKEQCTASAAGRVARRRHRDPRRSAGQRARRAGLARTTRQLSRRP